MSHIADWLTAIGHNYFIVIIGTVEILAAVMLITENLMRRIRKKTPLTKKKLKLRYSENWMSGRKKHAFFFAEVI